MSLTGLVEERQALDPGSPYWGDHVARYERALPHTVGARILDIACGTGYGLSLLRRRAALVVGVDVSADAIATASSAGATLVLASGYALPFSDGSFDLVTSFETLEHLEARPAFLRELSRILRPEGRLLLSTPNARHTRPIAGRPRNPFHVHEYTAEELRDELNAVFSSVELVGQGLRASFGFPPFWDEQERLPATLQNRARKLLWRAQNRLPPAWRDRLSELTAGHRFFPTSNDYEFSPARLDDGHVLFAECRGARA